MINDNYTTNLGNGHMSAIVSVILGIFTWMTPEGVDLFIKIVVGLASIGTALMAMRYYWFATKEKKANLKKHHIK